jgi:acyl-CoA hydrolase
MPIESAQTWPVMCFYSGIGGQVDFIRGASHSKGGKPIIAIPSTAKNGTISRIVPMLDPGAGVVTSRGAVHYIVTEFGVAYLHGRTIRPARRSPHRNCSSRIPGSTVLASTSVNHGDITVG